MALKLADALGTSPELWIRMQTQYDLWQASQRRRKKVRRSSWEQVGMTAQWNPTHRKMRDEWGTRRGCN